MPRVCHTVVITATMNNPPASTQVSAQIILSPPTFFTFLHLCILLTHLLDICNSCSKYNILQGQRNQIGIYSCLPSSCQIQSQKFHSVVLMYRVCQPSASSQLTILYWWHSKLDVHPPALFMIVTDP